MIKFKSVLFSMILIFVLSTALTACSRQDSTPQASAPEKKENQKASAVVLKTSVQSAKGSPISNVLDYFLDEVEKRSGGKVKFERYYGESLASAKDHFEALSSGLADVALFIPTYTPGKTPLATVSWNPCLGSNAWVAGNAYNELYQKLPEMVKDLEEDGVKFIAVQGGSPYYVFLKTKEPPKKIEDMKGLRLRSSGSHNELAVILGATPVSTTGPEIYQALERGVLDGAFFPPGALVGYSMQEVVKYFWKLNLGSTVNVIGVNQKTWGKLPEDVKKVMDEVAKDMPKASYEIYEVKGDGEGVKKLEAVGVKILDPDPGEQEKLNKLAEPISDKWAEDMEKKGLPGRKALNTYRELLKKYESQFSKK